MHEFEVFCEMTFFDFKLPIFCTAFRGTQSPSFNKAMALTPTHPELTRREATYRVRAYSAGYTSHEKFVRDSTRTSMNHE